MPASHRGSSYNSITFKDSELVSRGLIFSLCCVKRINLTFITAQLELKARKTTDVVTVSVTFCAPSLGRGPRPHCSAVWPRWPSGAGAALCFLTDGLVLVSHFQFYGGGGTSCTCRLRTHDATAHSTLPLSSVVKSTKSRIHNLKMQNFTAATEQGKNT